MEVMTKICSKCRFKKCIGEFGKNKRKPDGIDIYCFECRRKPCIEVKEGYKQCSKCKEIKLINLFHVEKSKKCGLSSHCISCKKEPGKIYRGENKEKLALKRKEHYNKNKDHYREYQKKYRTENKKRLLEQKKEYYKINREIILEQKKEYVKNNPEKLRIKNRKYFKEVLSKDPNYKIKKDIQRRMLLALNGIGKIDRTEKLLGCTIEEFKQHIELLFKPGMTWDNHGFKGWHYDHCTPCAFFDLTDPEQQRECFYHKNIQPLWWYDNLSKGAKIVR